MSRSSSPSICSARSKITCTWVAVSSTETSVSIHLRLTHVDDREQTRRARVKCVTSQIQIRFGAHTSQSGHGLRSRRLRGCGWGRTSPCSTRTRRNLDGDTHTSCW